MNKYDTELVRSILVNHGFQYTDNRENADVLLINTCGVREHAENRALSDISRMLRWKEQKPGRIVGMIGCLSTLIGENLLKSRPEVDLAIGPDAYRRLPDILNEIISGKSIHSILDIHPSLDETYSDIIPAREPGVRAWLAVNRGCDNRCSYCMVPLARGRVRNRPAAEVINEVKLLITEGYPEVVLLGQNVNAYCTDSIGFGGLLRKVADVPGLKRVRFLTSHPKDFDDDLVEALAEGGIICPDIHLPVQSGSDRILKAMNRGYTRSHYLELIEKLRSKVDGIAFSTDAIVGFPGETDEDFQQTLSLFDEVNYASGFVFRYSPRPGTTSFDWDDDVSEQCKTERLIQLNEALGHSRSKIHSSLIGKTISVLIEGHSPKHPEHMTGRSVQGYIVALPVGNLHSGDIVTAVIEKVSGFTLLGKVV